MNPPKKNVHTIKDIFQVSGIMNLFVLLCLLTAGISCSKGPGWEGFWQAKMEEFPGFTTVAELELRKEPDSGEWRGTYRNPEMMDIADLHRIHVNESTIEMNLGRDFSIHGVLSEQANSFRGVLCLADSAIDTVSFTRIDDWTVPPVRLGEDGQPVDHWNYKVPEETGDGWSAASLQDAGIAQEPLDESENTIGYGYQWWIGECISADKSFETVYASGHGGQFLWIVPELDLVVAALHHIPVNTEDIRSFYWDEMEQIVIPAVLKY